MRGSLHGAASIMVLSLLSLFFLDVANLFRMLVLQKLFCCIVSFCCTDSTIASRLSYLTDTAGGFPFRSSSGMLLDESGWSAYERRHDSFLNFFFLQNIYNIPNMMFLTSNVNRFQRKKWPHLMHMSCDKVYLHYIVIKFILIKKKLNIYLLVQLCPVFGLYLRKAYNQENN